MPEKYFFYSFLYYKFNETNFSAFSIVLGKSFNNLFDQLHILLFFWHYKIDVRSFVRKIPVTHHRLGIYYNFTVKLDLLYCQRRYRANKTFNVIGVPTKTQLSAKDKSPITGTNN